MSWVLGVQLPFASAHTPVRPYIGKLVARPYPVDRQRLAAPAYVVDFQIAAIAERTRLLVQPELSCRGAGHECESTDDVGEQLHDGMSRVNLISAFRFARIGVRAECRYILDLFRFARIGRKSLTSDWRLRNDIWENPAFSSTEGTMPVPE